MISDRELFANHSQGPFRNALVKTYGIIHSPISEVLAKSLKDLYGATIDFGIGQISIKGTHGFTWHLGGAHDPSVASYSLSSSIRGGPHRVHTADTFHCMGACKDLYYILPTLSQSPRIFLTDDDYDLARSTEILSSVANYWAPLRHAIESGEVELK